MAILNGWKEIATYLGRGVRTVQRWETVGLPVHRPRDKSRSPVVAIPEELDEWLKRSSEVISDFESPVLHSMAQGALNRFKTSISQLRNSLQLFRQYRSELRMTIESLRNRLEDPSSAFASMKANPRNGSSVLQRSGNGFSDSSVN